MGSSNCRVMGTNHRTLENNTVSVLNRFIAEKEFYKTGKMLRNMWTLSGEGVTLWVNVSR